MAKGITDKQQHIYDRLQAQGDASLSDLASLASRRASARSRPT